MNSFIAGAAGSGLNMIANQGLDLLRKGASAQDMWNHFTGGGYGGRSQNAGNVGMVQGQTDYNYQVPMAEAANDRLTAQQEAMADSRFYRNEAANDARRQANLVNDVAINDMANRANAAANVLNSYNAARQTNANFLASLQSAGLTQR